VVSSGAAQDPVELSLFLTEGFAGDRVVVRLDGATVFAADGVRTRHQVGLAASATVPAARRGRFEVDLPDRQMHAVCDVDPIATPYVRVSVDAGAVVVSASAEPPRFA
jgi:hypothetical protein